uniref:uncharacterized protein LOC120336558 n=1 Tax=Styela clava TaxID=7725 RepID=UPI0019399735|nr:uncharacterized protein LOC120336558 [Styela clava]
MSFMVERRSMTSSREVDVATTMDKTTSATVATSSQNVTLENNAIDIVFYSVSIILFGISLYVFVVLCIYLHRFLQKRRRSRKTVTSAALANGYGKIALSMRFVAASISLFCLVHFIFEQILLHSNCCDFIMNKLSVLIYGIVIMLGYVFFWLRQRVLYDAPAMRLFNSRLLRSLSWLSLIFVAINSAAQIILTCFLHDFSDPTWVYLTWLIGCVLVQSALMALFLYPLLKHGQDRRKTLGGGNIKKKHSNSGPSRTLGAQESNVIGIGIRDSNIFTVSSSWKRNGSRSSVKRSNLESASPMYRAARRCVVCASVAFISDVVAGIFMVTAHRHLQTRNSEVFSRFLFDFNLVVNSIFVVGCFANWRHILFPKCDRLQSKRAKYVPPAPSDASFGQRVFSNENYHER